MSVTTFRHEALLYDSTDDFVAQTASFVRDGLDLGQPTLVVVDAAKIGSLREALGAQAELVQFADMAEVGHNPARIIPAWREFVDANGRPGVGLRGVGEPISAERPPEVLVECQRHEQLLNLAFDDCPGFRLLCPYDTSLSEEILDEARRSHPHVVKCGRAEASGCYTGDSTARAPFEAPLPPAPPDAASFAFDLGLLGELRRFVARQARDVGLTEGQTGDLLVAVNEVATNSIRYGGGAGTCLAWQSGTSAVCEIADEGVLDDPLAGRRRPAGGKRGGHGLWVANQLCDLVQIRTAAAGTVVRLHLERR